MCTKEEFAGVLLRRYQSTSFWKGVQIVEGGNVTVTILPSCPNLCQGHFQDLLSIYFVQGRMLGAGMGNKINEIWSLHLRSLASKGDKLLGRDNKGGRAEKGKKCQVRAA